jgi:hypothetical protein
MNNNKLIHNYQQFGRNEEKLSLNRSIYWGEVIDNDDKIDGGGLKVRVNTLDNNIKNAELPFAYPLLPKFFHIIPKVGELVRVFIEDTKYPQRSRYWMGSIISQPTKISFEDITTALATTNLGNAKPDETIDTLPEAKGVYPEKNDIAIVGRLNNDIVLRDNEVELRAGKHENNNPLKLNQKNVGSIRLVFENNQDDTFRSSAIVLADKIALITHSGKPKFKSNSLTKEDRDVIFEKGSGILKGTPTIKYLEVFRQAILQHIHGYSALNPDKNDVITQLEKLDFTALLNNNIVTN